MIRGAPRSAWPLARVARAGLPPLPVLTVINFLNYFDRQIMYGLFPLVGADLHLSDTALGALGFANLLVFAISSLISGAVGRRFGLRAVVAGGVTVWSLATVGSALAPNYPVLLIMRALVGVGEGGFGPCANALLCADAAPGRRGRAMAIYNVGMALGGAGGGAFALMAGGALAAYLPPHLLWRGVLLVAGLPGFAFALLSLRIRIPAEIDERTYRPARRYLLSKTYLLALSGGTLANFGAGALISWMPTVLLRERHLSPSVAGVYLGAIALVCGAGGVLAGGYAGDALTRRRRGGHALVVGLSFLAGVPAGLLALFSPSRAAFLALTAVAAFLFSIYNGPIAAAVDEMAPRAFATTLQARFLLFVTLLGNAPAALITGRLSDQAQRRFAAPLAVALVAAMVAFAGAGILFVATARQQRRAPALV